MVRAAELYYEKGLNQTEIAAILGCSASTVSRLLSDAHAQGVVEIIIHRPVEKIPELSEEFRRTFNLRDAVVVQNGEDYEDSLKSVAAAAAELLVSVLRDNDLLAISMGVTLYHTVNALSSTTFRGIEVVQLLGGLGEGDPQVDGPELAMRFARKLNGSYRYINAPAVVETTELCTHLLQQPQIANTIERASNARVMLTGIGALADRLSSLVRAGYLSDAEIDDLIRKGAVGHLNGRMIDINGQESRHPYNGRVVGAPLEILRRAEWSIGVAASKRKAHAILGAIRGHYNNVLILDEGTAHEVLRVAQAEPAGASD